MTQFQSDTHSGRILAASRPPDIFPDLQPTPKGDRILTRSPLIRNYQEIHDTSFHRCENLILDITFVIIFILLQSCLERTCRVSVSFTPSGTMTSTPLCPRTQNSRLTNHETYQTKMVFVLFLDAYLSELFYFELTIYPKYSLLLLDSILKVRWFEQIYIGWGLGEDKRMGKRM